MQEHADFLGAEGVLRDVLAKADLQKAQQDQAKSQLSEVIAAHREMIQLDAIMRLIADGRADDASKQLTAMLAKATDRHVLDRIAKLLADDGPWWGRPPWAKLVYWLLAALPFAIAIGLILLLRGILFYAFWSRSAKWVLADVSDSSNQNAKSMIAHYFSHWAAPKPASVTSGLLVMEASVLPAAIPPIGSDAQQYGIAASLSSSDLTIWGVNLGSLSRAFTAIFRWMVPQPTEVLGTVYVDGNKRICARLTAPLPERNRNLYAGRQRARMVTVSATGEGQSEEALRRVSEEVTYKMLYALAREGDVGVAEFANDLRTGLEGLKSYLSASSPKNGPSPWSRLEEARDIFETVRKARPELLEAHIFEGIALDLLERHDDAAAHFDHVERETPNDAALHEKAAYNSAVAHLRNLYGLDPINESIQRLESLVRTRLKLAAGAPFPPDPQALEDKPLLTLALATLADAWANRTVQWRKINHVVAVQELHRIINDHRQHVEQITDVVQAVLDRVSAKVAAAPAGVVEGWSPDTRRQVEWAKFNALGDCFLYAAVEAKKLASEQPSVLEAREFADLRVGDLLDRALDELRKCEMLLPAGVETLSNIGTLYLVRGQSTDLPLARQYLRRAIALNPHYEYAYYRLAQSWEKEKWREKVVEVLKSWPIPPQIPSFRKMFVEYFVEPKSEYPNDTDRVERRNGDLADET
ncbi:lipopolysaccharide assembly protein LapB [Bradyrhizobium sp. SRS-191]|uniref:tetratricopeptide repeat protein n=1 Tax=Bradyrhizobium sp. SRS-191 TaxID=2962606 RepID=UPI00211E99E0|nr:hypothetical protein [Bradyrhizobium sp. SRS-191]